MACGRRPELPEEEPQGDLYELTVAQLKNEIWALNKLRPDDAQLPVSGTKAELIDRLRAAELLAWAEEIVARYGPERD